MQSSLPCIIPRPLGKYFTFPRKFSTRFNDTDATIDHSLALLSLVRSILLLFLFLLIKILFHVGLFSFYLSPWFPSFVAIYISIPLDPSFFRSRLLERRLDSYSPVCFAFSRSHWTLLLSRWRSPTAGTCKLQTNLLIRRAEISRARLRPRHSSRIVIVNFVVLE